MLSFEPNIVFIDDKKEEVNGLVVKYQEKGLGTKYYDANLVDGDDKPTSPFSDVNLIFLDLYYNDKFDVELCSGWIESIIPQNAFYILIIWSKDTQHTEDVIEDLTILEIKPFSCISIQKDNDYKNEDRSWNFEKLYITIKEELNKTPELQELALWKKNVITSSNKIIGHLSKDTDSDILNKKLQKIIIAQGGTRLESNNKFDQKRDALFEALDKILVSNTKFTRPKQNITDENKNVLYNIPEKIQADIDYKLNSWFHFNVHDVIQDDSIHTGLISVNKNKRLAKLYSIKDDPKLEPKLRNQIDSVATEIVDIVVVLSRSCDIAQNKIGKNVKLLCGININKPVRNNKGKIFKDKLPDSCKFYDYLYFDDIDNDVAMIFDFRYVFSVPIEYFNNKKRFGKIKIFNKEFISELQVEYANYSSRLGVTKII